MKLLIFLMDNCITFNLTIICWIFGKIMLVLMQFNTFDGVCFYCAEEHSGDG